ncbi:MAG: DNA polymerase III subunit delta [Thiomonas sp. 15-66-11]|uniref:DNA polymerase III subunit delta n=1 Tax=Thiomonas sp. TaxID=2047785 RepID=UPI000BD9C232|nr:DNA polymerase III subunit delta [Thiomonas sp.]OZB45981.1 MAG: DNA polymerase III subunit delta [Thiomonas sp. 15-66-11]
MLIRADQLQARLDSGLRGPYMVFGDELLLVNEAVDAIRAAAQAAGYGVREQHQVERGFDWDELLAQSREMSLFGERKLIEVRIPTGKPGRDGAQALAALAQEASSDVLVLVLLPRLDATAQKSDWFSRLAEAGTAVRVDTVEPEQLGAWMRARLARHGLRIAAGPAGQACLDLLVARTEGNLLAAHQEVEKLALLLDPGELDPAQVEDLVQDAARYGVFRLGEALLAGDIARLVRMLDGLQGEGVAPVLAHWSLAEETRAWLRLRQGLDAGESFATLARANRIWGPKEKLLQRALPRLNLPLLEGLLLRAAECDRAVKGLRPAGVPHQPWEAVRHLALAMAQAVSPQPAASAHGARLVLLAAG